MTSSLIKKHGRGQSAKSRRSYALGPKHVLASVIIGSLIAMSMSAIGAGVIAQDSRTPKVSVNRTNKADRLVQSSAARVSQRAFRAVQMFPALERVPLGCEPAFSTITDPRLEKIFGRCLT
jgi:hypothetical protein